VCIHMPNITVGIPIGPEPRHIKYLDECLDSVYDQSILPDEVLIVNDMNSKVLSELPRLVSNEIKLNMYTSPWRLGVAHAFNFCVACAENDYVIMLGADDTLESDCVERTLDALDRSAKPNMTYFWYGVRYSDGRLDQYLPCNAAMVSKHLWQATGGFAPESAVGAPDAAFISTFGYGNKYRGMVDFVCVDETKPLYNYRVRKKSDTNMKVGTWQLPILQTRNILTEYYELPKWGRYV